MCENMDEKVKPQVFAVYAFGRRKQLDICTLLASHMQHRSHFLGLCEAFNILFNKDQSEMI